MPFNKAKPLPSFCIPDILADYPWKRRLNPHYEAIKEDAERWMHGFRAFSTRSQYAFDRGEFALFCALAYPNVTGDCLRIATDMMHLLFILDEYTDVEYQEGARTLMGIASDALRKPEKARPKDELSVGGMTRQQILPIGSKGRKPHRLTIPGRNHFQLIRSCVKQASDRDANVHHSTALYLSRRRINIGAEPSFVIFKLGLSLPDSVKNHPVILELRALETDMTIYTNSKPSATTSSLQEAINRISAQLLTTKDQFLELTNVAPSFGSALDPQVREYLNGIGNWIRGVDCWEFECGRYFGDKGREIQRTRWVKLLPRAKAAYIGDDQAKRERVVAPLVEALEAAH